jgi:coatomer protein complex subunit alpha (xenin)
MRFLDQPLISITLATLQKMFSNGIEMTTKGEFNTAILAFRQCLQSVPLLAISSEEAQQDI